MRRTLARSSRWLCRLRSTFARSTFFRLCLRFRSACVRRTLARSSRWFCRLRRAFARGTFFRLCLRFGSACMRRGLARSSFASIVRPRIVFPGGIRSRRAAGRLRCRMLRWLLTVCRGTTFRCPRLCSWTFLRWPVCRRAIFSRTGLARPIARSLASFLG